MHLRENVFGPETVFRLLIEPAQDFQDSAHGIAKRHRSGRVQRPEQIRHHRIGGRQNIPNLRISLMLGIGRVTGPTGDQRPGHVSLRPRRPGQRGIASDQPSIDRDGEG